MSGSQPEDRGSTPLGGIKKPGFSGLFSFQKIVSSTISSTVSPNLNEQLPFIANSALQLRASPDAAPGRALASWPRATGLRWLHFYTPFSSASETKFD